MATVKEIKPDCHKQSKYSLFSVILRVEDVWIVKRRVVVFLEVVHIEQKQWSSTRANHFCSRQEYCKYLDIWKLRHNSYMKWLFVIEIWSVHRSTVGERCKVDLVSFHILSIFQILSYQSRYIYQQEVWTQQITHKWMRWGRIHHCGFLSPSYLCISSTLFQ